MDAFVTALGLVFDPFVIWVIFASAAFGMFVGAMPGLTATMATALLVPVTFFMSPHAGNAGVRRLHGRELRHVEEGSARPEPRRQPRLLGARRAVRGRDPDRRGPGARRVRDQLLV